MSKSGDGATRPFAIPDEPGAGPSRAWSLDAIPATITALTGVRAALADFARTTGLAEDRVHDVALAAYEAMANIVEHAYPPGTAETFAARAVHDVGGGSLTITLADHGSWKNDGPVPARRRGRGITLMRACSDHADIVSGTDGTTVNLRWALTPEGSAADTRQPDEDIHAGNTKYPTDSR